jgi:hypothetical protein
LLMPHCRKRRWVIRQREGSDCAVTTKGKISYTNRNDTREI